MRKTISAKIRLFVTQCANHRCEYCHFHEDDLFLSFEIDHIVGVKHGGGNELENLAYTCPHCNARKGSDLTTFLNDYTDIVLLFNPRQQSWNEHFGINQGELVAKTRTGQATIKLLRFNEPDRLILRQLLIQAGRYP